MLPQSTNRYGDLLRDAFASLQYRIENPNAPAPPGPRLDELQRIFNEFSDRELKYRSFLGVNGLPVLNNPTISNPVWGTSPLHAMQAQRATAQSIPDNTLTSISFQAVTPSTALFENTTDATKIRVKSGAAGSNIGRTIGIIGTVEWALSGVGRRAVTVEVYDENDSHIAGLTLQSMSPTGVDVDTLPISGGLYFASLDTAAYIRIKVLQSSGGALNLNGARIYLFLLI